MDRIESLGNQLSQITLYDIKSMYNQAKNVVLNISETEAKVREATNDEPWGASSTLMQEIAQGTFNFQQFNEIMPCIYGRFMEKEARQWRQIYKSLQLLEYLIKHGSERVVDDARSHIGTLKMLRSFHYIDEKGKDEGVNVRNRAKELVELLSDVDKIRTERRKAKANKSKFIGVGNEGDGGWGGSGGFSSGGRYGGFGSESGWGGSGGNSSNDYYGGGGSSSRVSGGFSDSTGRKQYEEYNAGDDESVPSGSGSGSNRTGTSASGRTLPTRKTSAPTPAAPAPAKAPIPNLLDFDDDDSSTAISASTAVNTTTGLATNKALPKPAIPGLDEDDFDDFQAAPVQTQAQTQVPAIQSPMAGHSQQGSVSPPMSPMGQQQQQQGVGAKPNLMQLLNATPLSPTTTMQVQQGHRVSGSVGMGAGMFGGGGVGGMRASGPTSPTGRMGMGMGMGGVNLMQPTPTTNASMGMGMSMRANTASPASSQKKTTGGGVGGGGGFDDLWNLSLASSGKTTSTTTTTASTGKSMKDLEKEKSSAGLWGGGAGMGGRPGIGGTGLGRGTPGSGFGTGPSAGGGGDDDLLL